MASRTKLSEPDHSGGGSPGPATDRWNSPVIDPTKNVLDLVEAAVERLADNMQLQVKRQDDLRNAEHTRVIDMAALRSYYEERLSQAESKRLDSIRAVDQAQIIVQGNANAQAALALAATVTQTAEANRTQVAALAATVATSLSTTIEPIRKDIADLRQSQYEGVGNRQATTESKSDNQWTIIAIIMAIGMITTMLSLVAGFLYYVSTHH